MQTHFLSGELVTRRLNGYLILSIVLLALFSWPVSAFAQCNTSWTGGGSGLWNAAGNWTAGVPTSSTNACIDSAGSTVTLNIAGAATADLTLGVSTDSLSFNNGTSLTISGNTISNAGAITMNSTGNYTELVIGASNVTLSGGGTLTLSNNAANLILGSSGTDMLTNQETIQGAGNIGYNQMALNNSGTIDANQSAGLTLQISGGATNTGTIEATGGNTLALYGGTYTNTGGTILNNASTLVFEAAVTINGGTITQTGAGTIKLEDATINTALANNSTGTVNVIGGGNAVDGVLTNQAAGSKVNLENGSILTIASGTVTNKGTINLESSGNYTELAINGNVTLAGTGKVILSANGANLILGSGTLINQNTIEGEGNIGYGQIGLVNTGSILANETGTHTPSTLYIDTSSAGFSNNSGTKNGILNVSAKNTVIIEGGPFTNFSSGTLTGGTYDVTGTLEFAAGTTGIVTNDAIIDLTSSTAAILNTSKSNASALTGLASNGTKGSFTVNALAFTTVGNFTNSGTLGVGTGGKFAVGTNGADDLTNFSGGTSTLTGGIYILTGTGQLQFNNQGNASDIVTNDANITLAGVDATKSSIIDQTGANALANFATNEGSLALTTDW